MKIKTLLVTSALLAGSYCGSASAEGLYVGGGISMMDMSINPSDSTSEDGFNLIYGRFGKQFNDYISGEIRLGYASGTAEFMDGDTDIAIDVDRLGGVFFKFQAPVTDKFYPYFLFGYSRVEVEVSSEGSSSEESQEGMGYALGADYYLSDSISVSFEFTDYQDDNEGVRFNGFSLSLNKSF
jgi:opacity protein-like surface antigen